MKEVVIGMAHRGRLSVLANIIGKSYSRIFGEFEGLSPETIQGSGDVKYHLGAKGTHTDPKGRELSVQVVANPSHPRRWTRCSRVRSGPNRSCAVPTGTTRSSPSSSTATPPSPARGWWWRRSTSRSFPGTAPGDGPHRGQQPGGVHHLGGRRPLQPLRHRRGQDGAGPILHVNGDDPDAVVRVAQFAFDYRQVFNRDVVIDMVCYRRRGTTRATSRPTPSR